MPTRGRLITSTVVLVSLSAAEDAPPEWLPELTAARERAGLQWVGLTWAQAQAQAAEREVAIRRVWIDNDSLAMTMDIQENRVNVSTLNNIVVQVQIEESFDRNAAPMNRREGCVQPALFPLLGRSLADARELAGPERPMWAQFVDGEYHPFMGAAELREMLMVSTWQDKVVAVTVRPARPARR